jgi:D-glycero-D-manno-heptose 1,7-bisphosphate phosphatase
MPEKATSAHPERLRKAAFIDRDGVINEERAYVHKPEDFEFIKGTVEALLRLQAAGYLLVVITNQSGLARGFYKEEDYIRLTSYMADRLRAAGVMLDSVEHCPHLPDAPLERYRLECDCRKPQPGMLRRAMANLGIDSGASVLIGDRASDIEAGRKAGVGRCYIVRSGHPVSHEDIALSDGVFDDLRECVSTLLSGRFVVSLASDNRSDPS